MSYIYNSGAADNYQSQYETSYKYPQYEMQPTYNTNYQSEYNNNNNNNSHYYSSQQQQQQQEQQQQQQQQQYYCPAQQGVCSTYEQPQHIQSQYQYFNYPQNQQCSLPTYHQVSEQYMQTPHNSQQMMSYSTAPLFEQTCYRQEGIHAKEEFEHSYQESEKDENQSTCTPSSSHHSINIQTNQVSQLSSPINLKTEEISPLNTKVSKKTVSASAVSKKEKKGSNSIPSSSSSSSLEKTKQSISKNNIRNFLTPIVRMRSGFVDYQLLEKERVSTLNYDAFLKQHFYMPGQTRLNIRQTIFDSLLDPSEKTQLKEKKVFALIVVQKIQEQFMKLIIEKSTSFSDQEFKQQFEWINGINETIVEFLNSISN